MELFGISKKGRSCFKWEVIEELEKGKGQGLSARSEVFAGSKFKVKGSSELVFSY